MAYIVLADVKTYLGITSTDDDTLLGTLITAAQKEIEAYCKRSFEGTTSTRYYRQEDLIALPKGSQYRPLWRATVGYSWDYSYGYGTYSGGADGYYSNVLWLGKDLLSVSTLTNGDESAISSTGYWLEPRNDPPYQWVHLKTSEQWNFNTDGEISVAGTWGFSTSADATIQQLAKEMTAYLYRLKDTQVFDVTANPEAGVITIPKGVPAHIKIALNNGGYVRQVRFA